VTEGVTTKVGSDITVTILRTPDGSDHKSVDNYTLYKVMKAAIEGANQPSATDVLEQVIEVIHHPFDFRKKVSVNMEQLMQSNAARMATYGIVIGTPQLTLTLLANIETACKAEYGRGCSPKLPSTVVVLVVLNLCWGEWSTEYEVIDTTINYMRMGNSSSKYNNQLNSTMTRLFSNDKDFECDNGEDKVYTGRNTTINFMRMGNSSSIN